MKRTLLEMTQSILSDMDSEGVNSISDTVEALQVASVIEDTFYNIVSVRDIPEHLQLLKITSLSDSTRPTHFEYPENARKLLTVRYNVETTASPSYREIGFVDPLTFLSRMKMTGTNVIKVTDVAGGTSICVRNDTPPSYYTSFDDEHIVMDSYDASVDSTLLTAKTQAYGYVLPTFSQTDGFKPDLDDPMLVYLLAEAKSTCFSLFKSGVDPKVDQATRRLKSYVQNDQHRSQRENKRPTYGRR